MLFREFNIIAAAAYAAQRATDCFGWPLWEELDQEAQNIHMQHVMGIARGDNPDPSEGMLGAQVFVATAKAILDYNNGQGGLALEEIANIGGAVLQLELMTEDEVGGRPIRECVVELLHDLADRRRHGGTAMSVGYSDADRRSQALALAADAAERNKTIVSPRQLCQDAKAFYDFLALGTDSTWLRSNALNHALRMTTTCSAEDVVAVADALMSFLEPDEPLELTETVNGTGDQVAEPAEPTLQ